MKNTLIIIIFLPLFVFFISVIYASEESGGYAGSFLEWGAGSRAIAMGKTFTAIANDGTALYWNPAGLSQISTRELSAMHAIIFEDRNQNFLAFTYPVSKLSISAGWLRFGVSDIQKRSLVGELDGKFDDSENLFMLGSGYNLISMPTIKLNLGITAKYFYHSLHDYRGNGFGLDIGALSYFRFTGLVERISVGLTVQNLGAKLKWNTESEHEDNIPVAYRMGTAVNIKPIPLKVTMDLEKREKQDLRIHAGAEYWMSMLALRAGLNQNKLAGGIGVVLKLSNYGFVVDYAVSTDEIADKPLHFFSLSFRF
jgi:hypothetical protein